MQLNHHHHDWYTTLPLKSSKLQKKNSKSEACNRVNGWRRKALNGLHFDCSDSDYNYFRSFFLSFWTRDKNLRKIRIKSICLTNSDLNLRFQFRLIFIAILFTWDFSKRKKIMSTTILVVIKSISFGRIQNRKMQSQNGLQRIGK